MFSSARFFTSILLCATPIARAEAQEAQIISEQTLDLRKFELWTEISIQAQLLPEFAFLDSLIFKTILYQSDSVVVQGFVVGPRYATNVPIVIFNRGGNRDFSRIDESMLIDWISTISKHGFMVFASQYRHNDQFGGVEMDDVLNLLHLAKSYPGTDSTRIGMVGWSRGGLMTYLALKRTNEINCAVIGGAPSDMRQVVRQRPEIDRLLEKLIPNYELNKIVEVEKRSPILWVNELNKTDLLLIHGEKDERVNHNQTLNISAKLDSIGFLHKLWIVPNEDHILNTSKKEKDRLIAEWLKSSLQNR